MLKIDFNSSGTRFSIEGVSSLEARSGGDFSPTSTTSSNNRTIFSGGPGSYVCYASLISSIRIALGIPSFRDYYYHWA